MLPGANGGYQPFAVLAWRRAFRSAIPEMEWLRSWVKVTTTGGKAKSIFGEDNLAGDGVFFLLGAEVGGELLVFSVQGKGCKKRALNIEAWCVLLSDSEERTCSRGVPLREHAGEEGDQGLCGLFAGFQNFVVIEGGGGDAGGPVG